MFKQVLAGRHKKEKKSLVILLIDPTTKKCMLSYPDTT